MFITVIPLSNSLLDCEILHGAVGSELVGASEATR